MENWLKHLNKYPYEYAGRPCTIIDTLPAGKVLIRMKDDDTQERVYESQLKKRLPRTPTDFQKDILCPNCGKTTSNIDHCEHCEKEIEPFKRSLPY